jgi:xanthine dehydrogenase YagR molybdenum-binding subunit
MFPIAGRNHLSRAPWIFFGLKKHNVQLVAPFVGGGFGGKGGMWAYNQLAVMTARPVRLAVTREGVFRIVGGRTPSQQRVAIAADNSGKITAFIHEGVTAQSTDNNFPEQFSFPPRHLYAMESYRIGQEVCEVNRVANTFMRAPGESIARSRECHGRYGLPVTHRAGGISHV